MASIERLSTIARLPACLREGDLLMLDIDETIVRPEADATEPWFNSFVRALHKQGIPQPVCFSAGIELWQALQGICHAETPEGEATREALAAAARIPGVECVGLTARGPEVHEETVAQLQHCGVYEGIFSTCSFGKLSTEADGKAPLEHRGGIVYCSGSRKPAGLRAYEAAARVASARRVVLVDDRESHCKAVRDDCAARGQPFLGLHYLTGDAGASPQLPRGWQLLAAALATTVPRRRLLRMINFVDGAAPATRVTTVNDCVRDERVRLGMVACAAACAGAGACWLVMRR